MKKTGEPLRYRRGSDGAVLQRPDGVAIHLYRDGPLQGLDTYYDAPSRGVARKGSFQARQHAALDAYALTVFQKRPGPNRQTGVKREANGCYLLIGDERRSTVECYYRCDTRMAEDHAAVAEFRTAENVAGKKILLNYLDAIGPSAADIVPRHKRVQASLFQADFDTPLSLRANDEGDPRGVVHSTGGRGLPLWRQIMDN